MDIGNSAFQFPNPRSRITPAMLNPVCINFSFDKFRITVFIKGIKTGFPIVFNDRAGFTRAPKVTLESENKYIVNVGSVGQPRDGNPRACFCVYNDTENMIEFVRLDYEIDKTREKIIKAGLPVFLADRLKKGY